MEKERIMIVFCDIMGTYGIPENTLERQNKIKHFICLLDNIKRFNNDDKVIFSFISYEDSDEMIRCLDEIKNNDIWERLIFKKSFYDKGSIEVVNKQYINREKEGILNKPGTIIDYSKELSKSYEIDKVFYFDDTEHYHTYFNDLFDIHDCDFETVSIIPKSFNDLNDRLENYIHTNFREKQKIMKRED